MTDEWIVNTQDKLFDETDKEPEATDWQDMPEFQQEKNDAHRKIIISFQDEKGVKDFEKLLGQRITSKTKSLWFPPKEKSNSIMMWVDE